MIDRAAFGRTGHESSRVIFGCAALATMRQESAEALLPVLLEAGVNHLDVAASYGDAELRMAPWLAAHPGEFRIENEGFTILANVGDQDSDLEGGHAKRAFKLPNPMYYIPAG